jgi:hypothetical protein
MAEDFKSGETLPRPGDQGTAKSACRFLLEHSAVSGSALAWESAAMEA